MDQPGTINPAALNEPVSTISPDLLSQPSPRGTKRSRSPNGYGKQQQERETDEGKSFKRNRQFKSDDTKQMSVATAAQPVQTPRIKGESISHVSPSQSSPVRSTPGSATKAVVKALPTVRDHTTDQLAEEGDEYLPRETDPEGEKKVSKDGYPLENRKYKCKTFTVPKRGDKLFMLATECARVLGYRDSYLLFNKNRSLFKIIASQPEKDNLIQQEVLPYSYRSRQIAIVTARSMFRQFGSRLIEGGRRVRDDYWEAKAIKQGFTEEDAAGEKRPGAAKAREAAAAQTSPATALTSLPQGEIIYNNGPGMDGQTPSMHPVSLAPLSMIHIPADELRTNAYGNILRPRQEASGPAYQDRIQSSNPSEILNQAAQAAEFNKQLGQIRAHRASYLDDHWKRPHEQPTTQAENELSTVAPQNLQSPPAMTSLGQSRPHEQMPHAPAQMHTQGYSLYSNQNPAASPMQSMNRAMQPSQMQGSPGMNMGAAGQPRQPSYGGYPSNQMWQQPPQPQASPLAQHQMQYGQQQQMPPLQMPQHPNMYAQMHQMGGQPYSAMNRAMYQPNPGAQQFQMGPQSTAGQQPGMQGWAPPGNASNMQQDWQRYQ
ncbi:Hypothetical protein R9X50_00253400 [Acrodontium crateriforme]|uniref:Nuclear localization protein n=1 Tax=Acrodontium crateriforme TaxID=150365 RepID=A0AAQ3R8M1_9PEZI|nr:Hypothetical protein R9X50_00253400 [Acrodontium crateriforme]